MFQLQAEHQHAAGLGAKYNLRTGPDSRTRSADWSMYAWHNDLINYENLTIKPGLKFMMTT